MEMGLSQAGSDDRSSLKEDRLIYTAQLLPNKEFVPKIPPTSAKWQFSFRFSPVFPVFWVPRNQGNLEREYILQLVKGQVRD